MTPTAIATTCLNGHPRTPENTYHGPDGALRCRTCRRESACAYRQRNPRTPRKRTTRVYLPDNLPQIPAHGWRDQAACAGHDPTTWDHGHPEAYRICRSCPVRADCLNEALTNEEDAGVWGGVDAPERTHLRRSRTATA